MSDAFRHRIRVRYSECDLQGVVFNANYLTYLDEAVTELLRRSVDGAYQGMVAEGADMVVAEANVRYLSPARFDDVVDVELEVSRLGTTSMVTQLSVSRGEETLAEAELRHVFVHAGEGGKRPIPAAVRAGSRPTSPRGRRMIAPVPAAAGRLMVHLRIVAPHACAERAVGAARGLARRVQPGVLRARPAGPPGTCCCAT